MPSAIRTYTSNLVLLAQKMRSPVRLQLLPFDLKNLTLALTYMPHFLWQLCPQRHKFTLQILSSYLKNCNLQPANNFDFLTSKTWPWPRFTHPIFDSSHAPRDMNLQFKFRCRGSKIVTSSPRTTLTFWPRERDLDLNLHVPFLIAAMPSATRTYGSNLVALSQQMRLPVRDELPPFDFENVTLTLTCNSHFKWNPCPSSRGPVPQISPS